MADDGYEIDFRAVGEGERSGDAIVVRFGNLAGNRDQQFVMVIDGGTKRYNSFHKTCRQKSNPNQIICIN